MQTQGGAAAETAILSKDRRFLTSIQVDWIGNGLYAHPLSRLDQYASSITVDRALKGSTPEEILLIEGSSAAQLTFTIGGTYQGMDFSAIFSPYNGLSPLYTTNNVGAEVKYIIGVETPLGIYNYSQFVGNVNTITPDRATGTVVITALDRVEKLRRPVTLAHWSISQYNQSRGQTIAQLADTAAVIDSCLRLCDTSQTRYRPTTREEMNVPDDSLDGVLFWLNGTGSHVPAIGWMDNANENTYKFPSTEDNGFPMYDVRGIVHPNAPVADQTRRVQALTPMQTDLVNSKLPYWVSDRALTQITGQHMLAFVLNTDPVPGGGTWHVTCPDTSVLSVRIGYRRVANLMIGANKFWFRLRNEFNNTNYETDKITIPSGVLKVELFAQLSFTNDPSFPGITAAIRCHNTVINSTVIAPIWSGDTPIDQLRGVVEIHHTVSMNDIGYGFRNYAGPYYNEPDLWRQSSYVGVLDSGLNSLSFMPRRDGEEAWKIITETASAELGSVFWDEDGVFRFWNLNTIIGKQSTIVRDITLDHTSSLSITNNLDSVRNVWSVTASKKRSSQKVVFSAQGIDELYIAPGENKRFDFFIDDIQQVEPGTLLRHTGRNEAPWTTYWPYWESDGQYSGYVIQRFSGGVWAEPYISNFQVDWNFYLDANGILTATVYNPWAEPVRFATDDGKAALRLIGTTMITDGKATFLNKDRASINKYGARTYEASGDWYQEFYNLEGLMNTVLPRTTKPIPTTDQIVIPGDPRLQLGDTARLRDENGLGEEIKVQIYGISRTYTKGEGLTDTLAVEMIKPPGSGIWDSSQYGRWDQSLIWSD